MPFYIFPLLILLCCSSCKDYDNQAHYTIAVGETVDIYYKTNSCCYYCASNEVHFKHITTMDQKVVDSGPWNCDGCDFTGAFVFRGTSVGVDTVHLKLLGGGMECDEAGYTTEQYIIEVQ